MLLPKFISNYRRSLAKKLIARRYYLVRRHVYTQAEVQSDNTTRSWICIDGTRIMEISLFASDCGLIPCVCPENAEKVLKYISRQYYLAHRHTILSNDIR